MIEKKGEGAGVEQFSVGLYTLGCKVSQYETEAIAEEFCRRGFLRRDFDEVCDVYVINTCTVTAEADRKSRQCIRRALHKNPHACVMVTGCYAQTSADEVSRIEGVSYVSGSYGKMELARRALELLADRPATAVVQVEDVDSAPFEEMRTQSSPRTRAYIKIEDGCECRCTYCAIPAARGRVRSKKPEDVFDEAEALKQGGTREIVLTGIETASYGADLEGYRLIDLLEELDRRHAADRIRLGSLTPELMTEAFVSRLARLPSVAPQFHLSMQSGSDRVLARMKRRYNTTQALAAFARLRAAIPRVQLTTDIMVGFPGESDEMFEETLEFVRRARFLSMHVFAYSRRRGTPADTYPDQIPEDVKAKRSRQLIALSHKIRDEILDGLVKEAAPMRVLLETKEGELWQGHSDEFIEVRLPAEGGMEHGNFVSAIPVSHSGGILYASVAGKSDSL
jgi:threonylcarbamoyladenosine tRNA methylthiotransferase MtaB